MPPKYEKYFPGNKASEIIGVSQVTLRKWDSEGKIATIRTPGGKRLYAVDTIINDCDRNATSFNKQEKICYCRVSSIGQRHDLERQVAEMQSRYPEHTIVQDIGSGINWKRKGFVSLLQRVFATRVKEVVVAHRDRLCRFGFDLLEFIFESFGVKLVVSEEDGYEKSSAEELADDLLAIIHVFNCRAMGKRRYTVKENSGSKEASNGEKGKMQVGKKPKGRPPKSKKDKDTTDQRTAEDIETMDGDIETDL